jgi:ABC-type sugar transport system permease subunit
MIIPIYFISIIYCIYKMYMSYKKNNDVLYASPALETLAILVMAPVLMAVDISFTWIRKYKEYKEEKKDRIF